MSYSRDKYDDKCYRHALQQSTAAGRYQVNTPRLDCGYCLQDSPYIRERSTRINFDKVVDGESDLLNLPRKLSDCPSDKYQGPADPRARPHVNLYDNGATACAPAHAGRELRTEDTRYSDPPCNRRGTENGFNRWAWLVHGNPQCHAIQPFERLNSQRIIAKDTFRPCIPRPAPASNIVGPAVATPLQPAGACAWPHQDWHPASNHVGACLGGTAPNP